MWPFNKKKSIIVHMNNDVVEPVISEEQMIGINEVCHDLNQAQIEENMVEYLKTRGFDVTPSGTPAGLINRVKNGVIEAADTAWDAGKTVGGTVADTATGTFHVARGVGRTITGVVNDKIATPILTKINNLKELGS
jgi:hypothetical protein